MNHRSATRRSGFTLIELLVAISIILIITSITIVSVNFSFAKDRVKGAARTIQSYFAGARDRAIYAAKSDTQNRNKRLGVRLIAKDGFPTLADRMVYVESLPDETRGGVTWHFFNPNFTNSIDAYLQSSPASSSTKYVLLRGIAAWRPLTTYYVGDVVFPRPGGPTGVYYRCTAATPPTSLPGYTNYGVTNDNSHEPTWPTAAGSFVVDSNNNSGLGGSITWTLVNDAQPTYWNSLYQKSLIAPGTVVSIGSSGQTYRLATINSTLFQTLISNEEMLVSVEGPSVPSLGSAINSPVPTYAIQLPAVPMANQEPRIIGTNAVIDLSLSRTPFSWPDGVGGFRQQLDLLFDPSGVITGPEAAKGQVELVLADIQDSIVGGPWQSGKTYTIDNWVIPSKGNNGFVYLCTTAGTAGGAEPSWPTTFGATVTDGSVTWTAALFPTAAKNDRRIVKIATRTGAVTFHPVNETGSPLFTDPFKFAETGEVAK